ncbi:MAG: TPM domain-containing protein [Myxococcota bacterium]
MKLSLDDEQDLLRAIANAERGNRGEVRLHLEARCVGEPLARARAVFSRLGMHATKDDTGVLLYVATASRVCAVYSGAGIVSKPPEGFWKSVTDAVAQGFARGEPLRGLRDGLQRIGDMLREHVPGDDRAGDELPNTLSVEGRR